MRDDLVPHTQTPTRQRTDLGIIIIIIIIIIILTSAHEEDEWRSGEGSAT
jgi:hypothetical protein